MPTKAVLAEAMDQPQLIDAQHQVVVRLGDIPLTLGSGGGALLSGLAFGWYRSRNMTLGNMPTAASTWRPVPSMKPPPSWTIRPT